jgi:hypothetical protein
MHSFIHLDNIGLNGTINRKGRKQLWPNHGIILGFACRGWKKPHFTSLRIAGCPNPNHESNWVPFNNRPSVLLLD